MPQEFTRFGLLLLTLVLASSCRTYQVDLPLSAQQQETAEAISNSLDQIIFPEVSFENTSVTEVVRFIRKNSRIYDPKNRGVSLFVALTQPGSEVVETDDPYATAVDDSWEPSLTLSAQNVSLRDLLNTLCKQNELRWCLNPRIVIATPEDIEQLYAHDN